MDLELRNVQVKDVVLGDKNDLKDGVLTVDVEGLKKLILEDPRVTAVKVDLAKPGESCRILPVKDVVELTTKLYRLRTCSRNLPTCRRQAPA